MGPALDVIIIADGRSDELLRYPVQWLIREIAPRLLPRIVTPDFGRLPQPPRNLAERTGLVLRDRPPDLILVHRDAEREPYRPRVEEIDAAWEDACRDAPTPPRYVPIIPVRMTEAWLLFDADAISTAADRPAAAPDVAKRLPAIDRVERLPDPKSELHTLIRSASGKTGRKLKRLRVHARVHRVAELIEDFAPLDRLESFATLREELTAFVTQRAQDERGA